MKIAITGMGSISAIGSNPKDIVQAYKNDSAGITITDGVPVAKLTSEGAKEMQTIEKEGYKNLDPSVLYAIYASRQATTQAEWGKESCFGINIGSSRGATTLFEQHYHTFLEEGKCLPLASPTTTLGNISSWVAQDLRSTGFEMSHSITCSTALHALANGIAWIESGMESRFLVGGSEAPLTPFTLTQGKALKIYSDSTEIYPCRALDMSKTKNTMVLGEGAGIFCLEKNPKKKPLVNIIGLGFATEKLTHNVSISANASCLQKSMQMALQHVDFKSVDVAVLHTPGTIKGDLAEVNAIKETFKNHPPVLTNNKWKVGHTFGASGALSLEMAILMLAEQQFFGVPYISYSNLPKKLDRILVNAVGFGGNAVSVLLEKTY